MSVRLGSTLSRRLLASLVCAGASLTGATAAGPVAAPLGGGQADLVVSRDRLRGSINIRTRDARAGDCTLFEGCLGGTGTRRTLEFDTYVVNAGRADLRLGDPADHPNLYEYSACHGHYHLKQSFVYAISHGGTDTIGLFDPSSGDVLYRNANATGAAEGTYRFDAVAAGSMPIAGDWDRSGASRPGLYDPVSGQFTLLDSGRGAPLVFPFKPDGGALTPVAGDWDGDGRDTVGLYNPATHTFYLKKKNSKNKKADVVRLEPGAGDWVPIAGDWDGDDVDTVGLFDRSSGVFALAARNANGSPDVTFSFGGAGTVPIAGDWNQDGVDTVGVFDAESHEFMLRNENAAGEPDDVCAIEDGAAPNLVPLTEDWDYNVGDLLVPGHKEAFCWLDTQRFSGDRDMQFLDCNDNQGLTAGWADIYIRNTDCQWIDITDLAPGTYQLTVTVNAAGLIPESDKTNNSSSVKVHVPPRKHVAKAPEVTVTIPRGSEEFTVGQPVTIRWRVARGRRVTHQEIWLADVHDDHPSKVLLIDANVAPGARSYTWTPTTDFAVSAGQILVRAQDDAGFVGTDTRSRGAFRIVR